MRNAPDEESGTPQPASPRAEWGVYLGRVPADGSRESHAVAAKAARALEIPLHDVRLLLQATPVLLPRAFGEQDAHRIVAGLERDGAAARVKRHPHAGTHGCDAHPSLLNDGACATCARWICAVCRANAGGEARCARCRARAGRKRSFRRVRVALLLGALLATGLWAWTTHQRRAERTTWARPLHVAGVMLADAPLPEADVQALAARVPALGTTLNAEFDRHRPDGIDLPFGFTVFGPVAVVQPPPLVAHDADLPARARHAWDLWWYLRDVNASAGLDAGEFDGRVYLVLRPAGPASAPRFVEGQAEAGGEVGIVQAALGPDTVDGVLIAAAHELLHLLGATDKYDGDGRARAPEGLAEPERGLPQRYAEIMAGEIPLAPGQGRAPWKLEEVRVGAATAAEIGWTPTP
jgi:hypothetical protein